MPPMFTRTGLRILEGFMRVRIHACLLPHSLCVCLFTEGRSRGVVLGENLLRYVGVARRGKPAESPRTRTKHAGINLDARDKRSQPAKR